MQRSVASQVMAADYRNLVLVSVACSRINGLRRIHHRLQSLWLGRRSLALRHKGRLLLDQVGQTLLSLALGDISHILNCSPARNCIYSHHFVLSHTNSLHFHFLRTALAVLITQSHSSHQIAFFCFLQLLLSLPQLIIHHCVVRPQLLKFTSFNYIVTRSGCLWSLGSSPESGSTRARLAI